jgi:ketosteroid isomerase-like protein
MEEIRDLRIPVGLIVEAGEIAICEASFLCELANGDGRFDFDFAMTVEMRDGKIARLTEYFDTRGLVP